MATINDIAQSCGVSKSTVSRYLNGSGYVSEEVSTLIKGKIEEFNYVPSATARNLTTKKSKVIGVIIPEVDNPFFAQIFKGISQIADQHDFSIFYCDSDNDEEKELKALNMLRQYHVEGLILTPAVRGGAKEDYSDLFLEQVAILRVPVVLLDRDIPHVNWDGVFSDNFKGAYRATESLIQGGHKTIATIGGDLDLMLGRERLNGYKKALEDNGIPGDESLIFEGDFTLETAYEKMKYILENHGDIKAFFSPNNLTTMGILKALSERGLNLTNDLSLVGFDDIEFLNILNIGLTVISVDTHQMGREAMKLLISRMDEKGDPSPFEPRRVILEPRLIQRGSERRSAMSN